MALYPKYSTEYIFLNFLSLFFNIFLNVYLLKTFFLRERKHTCGQMGRDGEQGRESQPGSILLVWSLMRGGIHKLRDHDLSRN